CAKHESWAWFAYW
nr:immunoglobulin heavy chain junction region [Mus musculus]NSM04802.1 immunoglobulin heavy chain junction region [Mus musculus]NSM05924.1 immunoglobulin heavy chain junction region [Mus musculus]NSM06077.1 immunoglobulin heavy chain junction region [Mus musculus]NSM08992.1 immunoglobulin heavy chain junction region [Mus musculus]